MKSMQILFCGRGLRSTRRISVQSLARLASYSSTTEEYAKRNYANNISEYNTVLSSLIGQKRHYLLRDVYDDMLLDGVRPVRDTFHSLIIGAMKGSRLQDAFFFRDEMKAMGLLPDVSLYNFLISACGKSKDSDPAIHILEEMKKAGVKPNVETYVCLLNSCAASGRTDRVYAIVRDMTAAGLGLNKFCYAGLIMAHKNKKPSTNEIASKIIELVKQSKGWLSVEGSDSTAENLMMGVSVEELYNVPTASFINRRGFINRQLTVYHAAFHACAELQNIEMLEALLEMLKMDGYSPDIFIVMQTLRCYFCSGHYESGLKSFSDFSSSGRIPPAELYWTLVEGTMVGYTSRGMQIALETLEKMSASNTFLTVKAANELLLAASGEEMGGYTTANFIWDLMQTRNIPPNISAVEAYHRGLKRREVPSDDPRLLLVTRTLDNLKKRTNFSATSQS